MQKPKAIAKRVSPLAITSEEFRIAGHQLVDRIAEFFDSLPQRPVTPGEKPSAVRDALGAAQTFPCVAPIPRSCSTAPQT